MHKQRKQQLLIQPYKVSIFTNSTPNAVDVPIIDNAVTFTVNPGDHVFAVVRSCGVAGVRHGVYTGVIQDANGELYPQIQYCTTIVDHWYDMVNNCEFIPVSWNREVVQRVTSGEVVPKYTQKLCKATLRNRKMFVDRPGMDNGGQQV